jgi:hypothetical protein
MKITKSRLKQIIKEELNTFLSEQPAGPTMGRTRTQKLVDLIQPAALKWGAAETVEEVEEYPLNVWASLMDLVQTGWGGQHKNVYGCPTNPELPECGIVNSVLASFRKSISPLVEAINDGAADKSVGRFLLQNKRAIWGSMDYVPADKKDVNSYMKTKAWRAGQANPVLPKPGDARIHPEDIDDL